jgi:hypothetical protein
MFQEVEREFSMARWVGQLLIVYCLPMLLLGSVEILFRAADTPTWVACQYSIIGLLGACAGLGLRRLARDSAKEGAWVWLLPTVILAVAMICDAFSRVGNLGEFFYAGQGDPNPVPVILTMPTWGCSCYSAVVSWRAHRHATGGSQTKA